MRRRCGVLGSAEGIGRKCGGGKGGAGERLDVLVAFRLSEACRRREVCWVSRWSVVADVGAVRLPAAEN